MSITAVPGGPVAVGVNYSDAKWSGCSGVMVLYKQWSYKLQWHYNYS